MRRGLVALLLSVLLLFAGVDSSAIGAPAETVPAVASVVHHGHARSGTDAPAPAATVVRTVLLLLLALASVTPRRTDLRTALGRSIQRWAVHARRGPPAFAPAL